MQPWLSFWDKELRVKTDHENHVPQVFLLLKATFLIAIVLTLTNFELSRDYFYVSEGKKKKKNLPQIVFLELWMERIWIFSVIGNISRRNMLYLARKDYESLTREIFCTLKYHSFNIEITFATLLCKEQYHYINGCSQFSIL